jgi:hypothetical protein
MFLKILVRFFGIEFLSLGKITTQTDLIPQNTSKIESEMFGTLIDDTLNVKGGIYETSNSA